MISINTSKLSLRKRRTSKLILSLLPIALLVVSCFILPILPETGVEDAGGPSIQEMTGDYAISETVPSEPIWLHVYDGFPDSDNSFSSVFQNQNGDLVATGTDALDWFTVLTDSEGGGADNGQEWTDYYGTLGTDNALAVVQAIDNDDVVIAGYVTDSETDFAIRRLQSDGTENWTVTFTQDYEQVAYDIAACSNGDFAVVGSTVEGLSWPSDMKLIRIFPNGTESWNRTYGGSQWEEARSVIECSNGDLVLAGMSTDVAGTGEDLWILRVDGTNGDVIWEEIIGGSHDDWGEEVIECTDGGIAVIGTKDIFGYKDGDIWIVKISSDGVVEWDQSYGGLENDFGMSLAEIPDGFALVGTSESYGSGNSDVWFIRIDDLGNVLWDQTYGGEGADTGNEIVVGQNGGLIIAGGTESWGGPDEDGFLMFIADSPHLFEEPTDVTIPIGTNFTCKLSATATFLDTWWINDTENFMIDNDGYIISKHLLPYGNGFYGLEVNINDTLDNILTSTFRISITYSPSDDTFSPLWEKSYLGPSSIETRAEDIVNCKSGGYLCVGKDYVSGSGTYTWLIRIDEFGNFLWNRTLTMKGYLYSIYECENGDFVGCGSNGTGWFTRFDSEGNMLWKNNTPTNTGSFASTIESSDGGLVFVGSFINISSGNIDAYVLKTSPTGHLIWNITYTDASIVGPVQMFASSVMESSAGDLIIAGWSVYADAYTMCISQTGTIIWAPGKDGNNDAYYDPGGGLIGIFFLDNLVECPDGGFVIAGAAGEQSNASSYGIWVVKTSSLGILEWQRLYRNVSVRINGYASAISITRTESSGFAILYSAMTAGGNYTTRLLRINENGTKLWEELYSGWGHYIGTAIVSTEYGGYLMVGYYEYPPYDYDKAWLKLLRPVQWTEIPIDRSVEYGNSFSYSFEVPTEPSDPHTDEFGGHYYTFYEDLLTWRSAQSVCQNMFGHLATISSSAENAFVFSLVDEVDSSVHLGGFDQTDAQNWEWVTRESWSYTNWSSGEPNLPTTENYLEMLSSGFWNNVPHSVQTYVCEWDYDYWNYYCGVNDSRFSVSRVGSYFEITNQTQLSVGEYQLRIKVSDGGGDFICKTITVTVESSAPPEWIEQPANQNLEFGSMFDITLLAGDRTGIGSWWLNDTENFDIDSGQISSNGVLAIGQYPIEVQVADVLGNTAVAEFVITVADTTAPEFISEPVNQVFEYGELLVYNIGATDLSGIDKWWLSDATHISVSEDGILEQNYVLPVGLYPLDIFVNDTQGNIRSASITLTVSLDPSIWIIDPEDQIAEFYQDFKYSLIAYAPGDFSEWWLNDSINFNIDNGGVVSNATTLEVGTYGLHVIATDVGGQTIATTFRVSVMDTIAPTWIEIPELLTVEYDDKVSYQLKAKDPSGVSHWSINNTNHFTVTKTGYLTISAGADPGTYGLEVTAYDIYYNTRTFTITIHVVESRAPRWLEEPEDQTSEFGSEFVYQLHAEDLTEVDTWWLANTTSFLIDENGRITSATYLQVGEYPLTVWVSDTLGNARSYSFAVHVVDTTAPIWVTQPMNQGLEYRQSLELQITAWDLSGIAHWAVNDTNRFSIDQTGLVTTSTILDVGVYYLSISASDPFGNQRNSTITIVVRSLSPQSLSMPTALTIAIGLSGGIIFLLFTIVYVIKRPNITEATRADSKIKRRMR